jgi:hypothetical protein
MWTLDNSSAKSNTGTSVLEPFVSWEEQRNLLKLGFIVVMLEQKYDTYVVLYPGKRFSISC